MQVIQEKYGVGSDQLRAYIHYHPSYYHLHVHFMHLKVDAGAGMAAGKAHLLDDVIGKFISSRCCASALRTQNLLQNRFCWYNELVQSLSPSAKVHWTATVPKMSTAH